MKEEIKVTKEDILDMHCPDMKHRQPLFYKGALSAMNEFMSRGFIDYQKSIEENDIPRQPAPPSGQGEGMSKMWDLLTELYQLYVNDENLGIEWGAFAEKVGAFVITDKENEVPEGYHWSVPSGKYHDDKPVLRKNRIETPTHESQWPTAEEIEKAFGAFLDKMKMGATLKNTWYGAIQWLQTSGVREGTRERENQWCDNDMKNALSEHYPGTDIDDYFKTWIVNYKK